MAVSIPEFFKKHGLTKVQLNVAGLTLEFEFDDADRDAAWDLYVEMLTRITTQRLPIHDGDELTALASVHSLFPTTREILRARGRRTIHFSKIAIPVLNQVVRPFTSKWHRKADNGAFDDPGQRSEFRKELAQLRCDLLKYNRMLAEIAGVEDLTNLATQGSET